MTISAKVIKDSISPTGIRLISVQLRYPKFIHGELMTHRVFSRNASSSRAIPVKRMLEDVRNDTAKPIHWGKNQTGMQANQEHNALIRLEEFEYTPEEAWNIARDRAMEVSKAFTTAGYHKQLVNRICEPFTNINTLVTATDWMNWFILRNHKDAQPEIEELAIQMKVAFKNSVPKALNYGEWHLPYITDEEMGDDIEKLKKVSAARSARVSYLTHDGKVSSWDEDITLFERLAVAEPFHASPTEHQAEAMEDKRYYKNLRGWQQFRAELEVVDENYDEDLALKEYLS